MTTEELFLMSSDARSTMQTKAAKARFTGPPAFPCRATASPANGFSRHTRHESRTLPPPGRCFPARCGAAWGGYGAAWAAAVSRSGNTAIAAVRFAVGGQGGATKIRRRTSVSSEKSRLPCRPFPTISHYFPVFPSISRPPPTPLVKGPRAVRIGNTTGWVFTTHETRITNFTAARSLLSCALWCGMGRLWRGMGGRRPPLRQQGLLGFHQPRDTQHGFSLSLRRLQREQPQPRPTGFSRITSHESRITAFMMMNDDFPCAKTCRHSECPGRLGSYGRL